MSDFDKEAEREKLREKYERDKEEREATQRMSDLLLKGATMTNAHCGTCGDPLFQQNGTTFCPSCHGNPDAVEGTDLEAQPADGQSSTDESATEEPAGQATADAGRADETRTDATTASTPETAATSAEADSVADANADSTAVRRQRGDDGARDSRSEAAASSADPQPQSPAPRSDDRRQTPPSDGASASSDAADGRSATAASSRRDAAMSPPSVDGGLEAARDDLVRALEKFAAEAAATDDPKHARECLEAAREAGETLSTLR
ncbi:Sjogren's syndrome/scleroderma autoantigen 1 family protein [Natrinema sp. 74]|uniref:Sjogren's syndrome/scleroderma autoantigen 1 family protein n=1 Tax=Natrinema sp. 74 TaxID=3384159 RepID=UPI0038D36CF0